jgi:uncharacterized protein YbcI
MNNGKKIGGKQIFDIFTDIENVKDKVLIIDTILGKSIEIFEAIE